jgi:ABC-type transport system substrate-binding protein
LALGPALWLAACGRSGPEGEVLRVVVVGEAGTSAPLARALADEMTAPRLIERDAAGKLVGGLASSWRFLDDGSALILRLRPVKWSDDRPLVAADVVESFRRAARPPTAASGFRMAGVQGADDMARGLRRASLGVSAPTPRVVEIRLAAPSPLLLEWLAEPDMAIKRSASSKAAPEATLGRYAEVLADAGATGLGLVARLQRRGQAPTPEAMPAETRIHATAALDKALAAFRQGEMDIVLGEGLAGLGEARVAAGRRDILKLDPVNGVYGWRANALKGPLADPALRRALADVVDRAALTSRFGIPAMQPEAGLLPPALRPLPPQLVADETVTQTTPGVAAGLRRAAGVVGEAVGTVVGGAANVLTGGNRMEAEQLAARQSEARVLVLAARLTQSGRTAEAGPDAVAARAAEELPPLQLTLLVPPGREHRTIAERVAADWRPLGVELRLKVADSATRAKLVAAGDFDLVVDEDISRVADPAALLQRFRCGAGPHCNAAADALLEAARRADPAERARLLAAAELAMLSGPPLNGWVPNAAGHPLGRLSR